VTVTATDGTASGSATFSWSVTNQVVTVTNPGTQSGTGGSAAALQISASDPANLPLTYGAAGLPPGLTVNASTGLISGTLASTDGGAYPVTVMAGDSAGNSGSATFTWNITYVNQAPTLANPGDQMNKAGDVVSLAVSGSDVDGDTVTYSATGLPPGVSMNATTGLISGTLSASSGSSTPYSVTVTASDGTLSASQTFSWFVSKNVVTLSSPGDQTNTEGDTVSLQLAATDSGSLTLSYQASGLPTGLALNTTTGLISGKVATGASANGPYAVTVTATDTQGNSSSQQFNWTINAPAHALSLTNPGAKSNVEGDTVSLQLVGSDPDGDTLSYAASGLPIGLMIDSQTGLISGTVDYSAAEIAGGQYNVTVSVNDGNGDTATQSFVWTIADTEQGPWLAYPGYQNSQTQSTPTLQLNGGSPDGKALTYSATGLPAGLTVNAATGLISGAITAAPNQYAVTASVTDGVKTASQTFTWNVTSSAAPQVILAINGTVDHSDDVGIVNPSLTIPLKITLQNATPGVPYVIQISIPSGRSYVSQSQITLENGGSTTIQLTPTQESLVPDDVDIQASINNLLLADQKMTNVTVGIEGHIRNTDTPKGMADRIPPSENGAVKTAVQWTLSKDLGPGEDLFILIHGDAYVSDTGHNPDRDAQAGEAFFAEPENLRYRSFSFSKAKTYTHELWGDQQTASGHAGKIILSIGYTDQKPKKSSEGFSVVAIPSSVTEKKISEYLENREAGMEIRVIFNSDSLNRKNIEKTIQVLEKVKVESQTGAWKDLPRDIKAQKDYATIINTGPDTVSLSVDALVLALKKNKTSDSKLYQGFIFKDLITGAKDIPIPKSGFLRYYSMPKPKEGVVWQYSVSNTGETTKGTKLEIEVAAGSTDPAGGLKQLFDVFEEKGKLIVKGHD